MALTLIFCKCDIEGIFYPYCLNITHARTHAHIIRWKIGFSFIVSIIAWRRKQRQSFPKKCVVKILSDAKRIMWADEKKKLFANWNLVYPTTVRRMWKCVNGNRIRASAAAAAAEMDYSDVFVIYHISLKNFCSHFCFLSYFHSRAQFLACAKRFIFFLSSLLQCHSVWLCFHRFIWLSSHFCTDTAQLFMYHHCMDAHCLNKSF